MHNTKVGIKTWEWLSHWILCSHNKSYLSSVYREIHASLGLLSSIQIWCDLKHNIWICSVLTHGNGYWKNPHATKELSSTTIGGRRQFYLHVKSSFIINHSHSAAEVDVW